MKILILCTGNSCRSQMVEGFLKSFDDHLDVFSAGTEPASVVNPYTIRVMAEEGVDLSHHYPKNVDVFLGEAWDYVITVCGGANESCPAFTGIVRQRMHIGFDDPAAARGTEEEILQEYRRVRDEIKEAFSTLYSNHLKQSVNMENAKELVKEKYDQIARQSKESNQSSCCGATACCSNIDYTVFSENYDQMKGYNPDADLGLGCGIPTEFANIKSGDTVIDLGSGTGNDCFVARALVGDSGLVIGVDMTESMIGKARENASKLGFTNVQFRLGDIENLPVTSNKANVIISNCVLNLVPDKQKAFAEIFRVLKPGGHLSISDVVLKGELPLKIRQAAEMYAGCVAGAMQKEDYLQVIKENRMVNIRVQKEKMVVLPDEILQKYLDADELKTFKERGAGIYSITVYAEKPSSLCCSGESGCC